MADIADKAAERLEQIEAEALARRMPEGPKATGYCLECGEAFVEPWENVPPLRWCNAECRDRS